MAQKIVTIIIDTLADGTANIRLIPPEILLTEDDTLAFEAFIAPEFVGESPRAVFADENLPFTDSEVALESTAPPPPPEELTPIATDVVNLAPGDVLSEHDYVVELANGAMQAGRIKIIRQQ